MSALKKSMRWDEQTFGLECDLDHYMIVAVGDFNMGAMENKGLNIFNTKYVLARQDVATDIDYENIDRVVAHEYFHNWTGNRVTCRDWFQLSLKEGLTVFRDQEFGADVHHRSVARIREVRGLRAAQFPEDGGPMAHPVRPASYIEINNFYTATVYQKGAEVVRMIQTLIGKQAFRRGMDLYFARHDGQAVTCDDFVAAMADASGADFSQFMRWYEQAGTPHVAATGRYDAANHRYTLRLSQSCAAAPGQAAKQLYQIPVAVGLVGPDGKDLPLRLAGDDAGARVSQRVLSLCGETQEFVFEEVAVAPVPSLLRDFSAPVVLDYAYSDADLAHLMAHDSDPFNRWEAGQRLANRLIIAATATLGAGRHANLAGQFRPGGGAGAGRCRHATRPLPLKPCHCRAKRRWPNNWRWLTPTPCTPPATACAASSPNSWARNFWLAISVLRRAEGYRPDLADVGRRALRNVCLGYLCEADSAIQPRAGAATVRCRRQHDRPVCQPVGPGAGRRRGTPAGIGCLLCSDGKARRWSSTSGCKSRPPAVAPAFWTRSGG